MKIKDLLLKARIWNKHKKTQRILYFLTYIIFFPIVILQIINDFLDIIVTKFAALRLNIVRIIFKMIYKKELEEKGEKDG